MGVKPDKHGGESGYVDCCRLKMVLGVFLIACISWGYCLWRCGLNSNSFSEDDKAKDKQRTSGTSVEGDGRLQVSHIVTCCPCSNWR